VEYLWFVAIDTARLRHALTGVAAITAARALAPAADATGARVIDSCVVACGVRALVATPSADGLRKFVRRYVAMTTLVGRQAPWRPCFRAARVRANAVRSVRSSLARMRSTREEVSMPTSTSKLRGAAAARKIVPALRLLETAVDEMLGTDEAAARVRRYVAEHEAPADDRAAFERLCIVVFAQGLGYETVLSKAGALRSAFDHFNPSAVAAFDEARIAATIASPIIRNEMKIRACIENARRWMHRVAEGESYLGRIASIASTDDPAAGWPQLSSIVREDFERLGDSTARQTLKRWGFFTAFAHPGARRVIARLGFIDADADAAAIQRLIGTGAQRLGRDPYAVEASLALFAGLGPCRKEPACDRCRLADRCPSAVLAR
jgi:3-methyladenine DNA glycosylase Tag